MKKIAVLVVLATVAVSVVWAQAGNRYALVIGNAEYADHQGFPNLPNAQNDAQDISAALTDLGYCVKQYNNLCSSDMDDVIIAFAKRLGENALNEGFFWYAGHAVQIGGEMYLLPVDVPKNKKQIVKKVVSLKTLMDKFKFEAPEQVVVLMLDACRNTLYGEKAETSSSDPPKNMFVLFSTKAGKKASDGAGEGNSPFAKAFLERVRFSVPLMQLVGMVTNETERLTGKRKQQPHSVGFISVENYSLNPKGSQPAGISNSMVIGAANVATGSLIITTIAPGMVQIIGSSVEEVFFDMPAGSTRSIDKISIGNYQIIMYYKNGTVEVKKVKIVQSKATKLDFKYQPVTGGWSADSDTRLNTIGFSLGSSYPAPLLTGSVHGTISPFNHVFLEAGLDVGGLSSAEDVNNFSLYPFAHLNFFLPFDNSSGWFIGGGGGHMWATYYFPEGELPLKMWAADFVTGFILSDFFMVSYTARTDFATLGNKFAVSFVRRFK